MNYNNVVFLKIFKKYRCLDKNVDIENSIYDDRDQSKKNVAHEKISKEKSSNENNIKINDTEQLKNDSGQRPGIIYDKIKIILVERDLSNCLKNLR